MAKKSGARSAEEGNAQGSASGAHGRQPYGKQAEGDSTERQAAAIVRLFNDIYEQFSTSSVLARGLVSLWETHHNKVVETIEAGTGKRVYGPGGLLDRKASGRALISALFALDTLREEHDEEASAAALAMKKFIDNMKASAPIREPGAAPSHQREIKKIVKGMMAKVRDLSAEKVSRSPAAPARPAPKAARDLKGKAAGGKNGRPASGQDPAANGRARGARPVAPPAAA